MLNDGPTMDNSIDLTGQTIQDYLVIRRLGRGGMADVYLAQQLSLKRSVALKILKPELARDKSYIERFQREAQSAASLVQANIVQIYEVGQFNGLHYIAQEYVVGRNLREYIARFGAINPVMAINVLRQVALALQKADEHNVTHRDIKPENIMLTPSGEVKVTDFGLARINDGTSKELTQIGITMGTPLYMSPEQIEGQPVDVRSDIYSLGVTAYHMLAGKPPYDGDTALAIALKHVKNDPEPLSQVRPDVPGELTSLINRMMAKTVADRPSNAGQLLKEIKSIKIDMDEDWDQLVESLAIQSSSSGTIGLPDAVDSIEESRLAVTRQLQTIMKGNIRSWWRTPGTWASFALLAVLGLLAGIWIARQDPVPDPLQAGQLEQGQVPKMASASEQYQYAVNSEPNALQNYQAVINYFGQRESDALPHQTQLAINRARERIGEIYLDNEQWKQAEGIFLQLLETSQNDRCRVVGHIGLAVVFDRQDLPERAQSELMQVDENQLDLLNTYMRTRYDDLMAKYGQALPGKLSQGHRPRSPALETWIKSGNSG